MMQRVVLVLGVLLFSSTSVHAGINLEWRPVELTVSVGEVARIGLYAVSDDTSDQPIASMNVLAGWDPYYLELLGNDDDGPYDWYWSLFPDNAGGDGMNVTWDDGDAKYTSLSQFGLGNEAYATPEGLLVTTFEFLALAETPEVVPTPVSIMPVFGDHSDTVVYAPGGGVATGDLGDDVLVTIIPEPAVGLLLLGGMVLTFVRNRRDWA